MSAASTPVEPSATPRAWNTSAPFGRIQIVTSQPIPLEADPGPAARIRAEISRRPWIFPAALLGAAAVYLLARRR